MVDGGSGFFGIHIADKHSNIQRLTVKPPLMDGRDIFREGGTH
jgi:hypothetical protein